VAINGYKAREIRTPSYVCWLLNLPRTYVSLDTLEGIQNKNWWFSGSMFTLFYTPQIQHGTAQRCFSGEYHSGISWIILNYHPQIIQSLDHDWVLKPVVIWWSGLRGLILSQSNVAAKSPGLNGGVQCSWQNHGKIQENHLSVEVWMRISTLHGGFSITTVLITGG
jgi:hypothetical protein